MYTHAHALHLGRYAVPRWWVPALLQSLNPTRRHAVYTYLLLVARTHYLLTYRLMQRHRLHAFGEFKRGQADPDFRKTDSPHNLLASGVRASFRAWI